MNVWLIRVLARFASDGIGGKDCMGPPNPLEGNASVVAAAEVFRKVRRSIGNILEREICGLLSQEDNIGNVVFMLIRCL
jgi:hypothetical protein